MAVNGDEKCHRAIIGNERNFWLYTSKGGFDLTHPPLPSSPPVKPNVTVQTTTKPITIDPAKTALVIIDMQNFFLSPAFGRAKGGGHAACDRLVKHAIPAARQAGIRVIWLNWGLTDQGIDEMPPAVTAAFGLKVLDAEEAVADGDVFKRKGNGAAVDKQGDLRYRGGHTILDDGKSGRKFKGLGSDCGVVEDPETGEEINAGKLLMRDSWNAALYPPLDKLYQQGKNLEKPDVWIHKNRMSGMWGGKTACSSFLEEEGIRTLMFSGVNTDQCVGGTFMDSFSLGYDCILLSDGAAND